MAYFVSHTDEYCVGPFANIVEASAFAAEQNWRAGDFQIVPDDELVDKEQSISVTPEEFRASAEDNLEANVTGRLIKLANHLDDLGCHQSAGEVDGALRELMEPNKRTNDK